MKKAILLFSLLLMNSYASANEELAAKMQEMLAPFKVIGGVMRGEPVSEDHIAAASTLQKVTAQAALIYPDTAVDDSTKLQYIRLMVELMNASIEFESEAKLFVDGESSDLENIRGAIKKMSDLRRSGHRFFRTR